MSVTIKIVGVNLVLNLDWPRVFGWCVWVGGRDLWLWGFVSLGHVALCVTSLSVCLDCLPCVGERKRGGEEGCVFF